MVIPSTPVIALETSAIAPVISSAALVVETTIVASPTGLCDLVPYLDSNSDSLDEMASLEVTTRSSSPSDFPIAHVTASPGTCRRASILIGPGEAIPLGRPYRTRPNGPRRVMTVKKQVGPLPAHRLALSHVSPRSSNHCPSISSSPTDSLPVHSSSLDAPESSSGDSSERPLHSSSHSVGPSHKRCRSLTGFVLSSALVMRSLALTRTDLLPPCKRFRDSYSPETSMKEDTEINTTETEDGRELDIVNGDDVKDHIEVDPMDDREEFEVSAGDTVVLGIDPRSVPMVDEEIIELVG
nr:hypothetical protein [Tanacetum cinerariifolium]